MQPAFKPGTAVTPLALRCSDLDRYASRDPRIYKSIGLTSNDWITYCGEMIRLGTSMYLKRNHSHALIEITNIMDTWELVDIWRLKDPDLAKKYLVSHQLCKFSHLKSWERPVIFIIGTLQLWQTKWGDKNPENHIVGFLNEFICKSHSDILLLFLFLRVPVIKWSAVFFDKIHFYSLKSKHFVNRLCREFHLYQFFTEHST
jgi:hypothetical protein